MLAHLASSSGLTVWKCTTDASIPSPASSSCRGKAVAGHHPGRHQHDPGASSRPAQRDRLADRKAGSGRLTTGSPPLARRM